jgi:hypothetical protein
VGGVEGGPEPGSEFIRVSLPSSKTLSLVTPSNCLDPIQVSSSKRIVHDIVASHSPPKFHLVNRAHQELPGDGRIVEDNTDDIGERNAGCHILQLTKTSVSLLLNL